jgi:hypothetical protein
MVIWACHFRYCVSVTDHGRSRIKPGTNNLEQDVVLVIDDKSVAHKHMDIWGSQRSRRNKKGG